VAGLTRFIGRKEYFGSILYDREKADYIPFDQDATEIFELSKEKNLQQIYKNIEDRVQQKNFETFIQLCQSIEILDAKGKFTGTFIARDWSREGYLSAPLRVYFSCTKACNFSCRHCFSSSGEPYPDELTTAEIKKLIDEMANLGCFELSLGGGEPLLRPDIAEIISHANLRNVSIRISTNAAAATKEVVKKLKSVKIRSFKISMEGASEKVYDYIRGKSGSYRKALRGIKNLKELGVPIYLQMVLMKPNISELPSLIRLGEKLKVEKILLETIMPMGRAVQNTQLLLDIEETNRLWEAALKLQKNTFIKIEIPHYVPFRSGQNLMFEGFGCKCGTLVCHIDARGNVAPTGFLKDILPAGNLREKTLKQIWDSSPNMVKFRNFEGNETCTGCSYYTSCKGGCRARALLMDKDINLPDGNCAIAHKIQV
jgi:radical SAM protein with 4Fe4S-binding SPASM domain